MTRENESPIVIYEDADKAVEVCLDADRDTVWLTRRKMAELFDTSSDNVSLHLKNIYRDEELEEPATTKDFPVVRQEGKRQVARSIKHYNLDAIISLGYRVNSRRAVQFRQREKFPFFERNGCTDIAREHIDMQKRKDPSGMLCFGLAL